MVSNSKKKVRASTKDVLLRILIFAALPVSAIGLVLFVLFGVFVSIAFGVFVLVSIVLFSVSYEADLKKHGAERVGDRIPKKECDKETSLQRNGKQLKTQQEVRSVMEGARMEQDLERIRKNYEIFLETYQPIDKSALSLPDLMKKYNLDVGYFNKLTMEVLKLGYSEIEPYLIYKGCKPRSSADISTNARRYKAHETVKSYSNKSSPANSSYEEDDNSGKIGKGDCHCGGFETYKGGKTVRGFFHNTPHMVCSRCGTHIRDLPVKEESYEEKAAHQAHLDSFWPDNY